MSNMTAGSDETRPHNHRGPMAGAWLLIGFGILLLLNNLVSMEGAIVLLILGGVFLAVYLNSHSYGWLVPAMILLGLGVGMIFEDAHWLYFRGDWEPLFLGVGFLAIYVVDRIVQGHTRTWPLWPGGILVVYAVWEGFLRYSFLWEIRHLVEDWWPLLLVIWGIVLLRRDHGKKNGGARGTSPVTGSDPPPAA